MSKHYKYPRTYHFPFSPGLGSDDKVFLDYEKYFVGKKVMISEKMDGENTSVYNDGTHARSLDSGYKPYRSYLINDMQRYNWKLEEDERICGEYLFAQHSIHYNNLKSYFQVFSIWHEDICLPWNETVKRCQGLDLVTVPVLYEGIYNEDAIKEAINTVMDRGGEGVVMRLFDSFRYEDFSTSIIKYVRANHVQTDEHWTSQTIIQNQLQKRLWRGRKSSP